MAIHDHTEILRRVFGKARGRQAGLEFPEDIKLTRRAKTLLESKRVLGREAGAYSVVEALNGVWTYDPDQYREFYNEIIHAQYGRHKSSAWKSMLIPPPLPPHSRPVDQVISGRSAKSPGERGAGVANDLVSGDFTKKLQKWGWMDKNLKVIPFKPRDELGKIMPLTADYAQKQLELFTSNFYSDDIRLMPDSVKDQVQRLVEVVEQDVFGRAVKINEQMLQVDKEIRLKEYRLKTESLSFMESERLREEVRLLRGDPFAPYEGRGKTGKARVQNLADLRLRRRAMAHEVEQSQYLRDILSPDEAWRVSDPTTSLAFKLSTYDRGMERLMADPAFSSDLEKITMIERQVAESFRSNRQLMRNIAHLNDPIRAERGAFRGMFVNQEIVDRSDFIYDGGEWRPLTEIEKISEVIVNKSGKETPLSEAYSRGRIKTGTAIKLTPTGQMDLRSMRFDVKGAAPIEENIQRVDYLRRMDRTIKSTSSTKSAEFKRQATDDLSQEVSRNLNKAFGEVSLPVDLSSIEPGTLNLYRKILGEDPLTPQALAKNLYLELLYGNIREKNQAYKVLSRLSSTRDDFSKETFKLLSENVPELTARGYLPSLFDLATPLSKTADTLAIPRTRNLFASRVTELSSALSAQDRMRLQTEKLRETMDQSRFTRQELDFLAEEAGPDWQLNRLRSATQDEIKRLAEREERAYASNQGARDMDGVPKRLREKIAREEAAKQRARLTVDPKLESDYARLFKRDKFLNGLIQEDFDQMLQWAQEFDPVFDDAGNMKAPKPFLDRGYQVSRDPEVVEDMYLFIKEQEKGIARAQAVAAARLKKSTLPESIFRHFTSSDEMAEVLAGSYNNPFAGSRDEVLARLYQMANERQVISATDTSGMTRDMRIQLIEQFEDRFEMRLMDQSTGALEQVAMRWQQNTVDPSAIDAEAFAEDLKKRMRPHFIEELKEEGIFSGEEFDQQLAQRELKLARKIESGSVFEAIQSQVESKGSFVFEETQKFMLMDADRYYGRLGDLTAADIPQNDLGVGQSLVRHMNLARGGFGVPTAIPSVASQSLFELSPDGTPRLARAFTPLVEQGDGIYRLDAISKEAKDLIGQAVQTIADDLSQRGIDLAEVIRLSDSMGDLQVSPHVLSLISGEAEDGFSFRQRGGRVAPVLGAGQTLEMPLGTYLKEGVLESLPEGTNLPPVKSNNLLSLGEAFAQAVIKKAPHPVHQLVPTDTSDDLLKGISDAIAKQWGVLTSEEVLQHTPDLMKAFRPAAPAEAMFSWMAGAATETEFMSQEAAEAMTPKNTRATMSSVMDLFKTNKTLKGAAIGSAAFLAWGVVTSSRRKKDHANEQVPNLPGGSPYEGTAGSLPYIQSANMGGTAPGQLYYINARGSFDPAQFQNQVQGITGGSVVGQIHSRADPFGTQRPSVEQRLS